MATSSMKKTVAFTAVITLISFLYKLGLGIFTTSIILIIASISTLLVFIAKITFVRNATSNRQDKKKAYLIIAGITLLYSLIFILFGVLKIFGIDTSNQKTYEGIYGAIFIAFILVMFILSFTRLRGALNKNDLIVIGLKEIIFVSALTDLVIIEEFVSRIVLRYVDVPSLSKINSYFVLAISAIMLIIPIVMIIRGIRYKADKE